MKLFKTPVGKLQALGACHDAVEFVRKGKFKSIQAAWDSCPRGDWLLWYAGKRSGKPESGKRKKLVLAACECARQVLPIFEKSRPGDNRVRLCIETAEKWARGTHGVTIEDVQAARTAAAYGATAAAAAYAATAAAYGAYGAYAAYAAAAAAYAAAAAAARREMQLKCANIVRIHYPKAP